MEKERLAARQYPDSCAVAPVHPATNFETFFQQQHRRVRRFVAGRLRLPEKHADVKDVVEDTFMRALASREKCREPKPWVTGVARKAIAEFIKQQLRWRRNWKAGERADRYLYENAAVKDGSPQEPGIQPDSPREQIG